MSKSSGEFFFQLLFLPVTIFFVLAIFSKIRRTKTQEPSIHSPHKRGGKMFFAVVLIIFLALLILNLSRIIGGQSQ